MVFEKLRGLRSEPAFVVQLREHKWTSEQQKRELLEKFQGISKPDVEWVAWTALDQTPEIRAAGLAILKRRHDRAGLESLVPLLKSRSEAVRRAVMRFLKDLAGPQLGPFLQEVASRGDDFARLAALDLARELPAEAAFDIARRVLTAANPAVRARALKAVSEMSFEGSAAVAASLAVPLLQDESEEIRYSALAVLEKNPNESYFPDVLQMARTGGGRVAEASFAAIKRLLASAKQDHTPEIVPLLADGNAVVRQGAVNLLVPFAPELLARRLLEHFRGSFVWVRDRAVETARDGLPGFVNALLTLTNDPDPAFAKAASEMTLALADVKALPVWIKLVDDPDLWVRTRAVEALGRAGKGNDDVLARLLPALKDPELVIAAASAVGDLGDKRAAQPLLDAFKGAATRPDVQMEILDAMGRLALAEPGVQSQIATICSRVSQMAQLDAAVRERARRLVGRLSGDEARDALPDIEPEVEAVNLAGNAGARLVEYLADTVKHGASDLHLATGFVPHRRVQGVLEPVDAPPMTRARATQLIREVLDETEWKRLERERQIDVCLKLPGLGRFRANFYSQRGGFDACFRSVPKTIPTIEEIGLPTSLSDVLKFTQGLVLVTGPSGCGKSTTLAALIDRINETRPCHIITVEDPVEFVHQNKRSTLSQREVGVDTKSFANALRSAIRQDPGVILVGELRDQETISLAITAAEMGVLVFGTLHTNSAPKTIDRVIDAFPTDQQQQVRTMLSESLAAVVSQLLLRTPDGTGRVAVHEILLKTPGLPNVIREGNTPMISSIIQSGKGQGMQSMDDVLFKLATEKKISVHDAFHKATNKARFEPMVAGEP